MDYTEQMIKTASPAKLIELLYQRAVELLEGAKKDINEKKFVAAKSLRALYTYMYKTLVEANVKKDLEKIEEVKGYLSELLETWREAMKKVGNTANKLPDPNRPRLNVSL